VPRHDALAPATSEELAETEGTLRAAKAQGCARLSTPRVALIVAMDESGVIGREGRLPWRQPADLMHFKVLTMGKPILMGRKTFDSIGRPLPGRMNLVLTRKSDWTHEGVITVHSVEEALRRAGPAPELMVIGGADIFRLALPSAQRVYLTRMHATVEGDVRFPAIDWSRWRELERQEFAADDTHAYAMTFLTLERMG
jgi:dihydrofolate reductase